MLTAWQAILLGILQGLTEFLPVSSSGHLVIAQALLGIEAPMLTFDVFVHVGTLAAVFVAFWGDIKALLRHPLCKTTALLVIGTIPAGLMGLFLGDFFESMFSSLSAVAMALIFTGLLLRASDGLNGTRRLEEMEYSGALIVGLFQGIAIMPGLSRSGSTIFGSLLTGLRRDEAARFSFLLSIPIILAAAAKQLLDLSGKAGGMELQWTYFLGAAVAGICGYAAIRVFLRLLGKRRLHYFSYYCWGLAALVIISQFLRG